MRVIFFWECSKFDVDLKRSNKREIVYVLSPYKIFNWTELKWLGSSDNGKLSWASINLWNTQHSNKQTAIPLQLFWSKRLKIMFLPNFNQEFSKISVLFCKTSALNKTSVMHFYTKMQNYTILTLTYLVLNKGSKITVYKNYLKNFTATSVTYSF